MDNGQVKQMVLSAGRHLPFARLDDLHNAVASALPQHNGRFHMLSVKNVEGNQATVHFEKWSKSPEESVDITF